MHLSECLIFISNFGKYLKLKLNFGLYSFHSISFLPPTSGQVINSSRLFVCPYWLWPTFEKHEYCTWPFHLKGLPGCFFTRTFLLKSLNNLEPMCNNVNIKSSLLVIFRFISVTSSFTVWGTHTTNGNLKNLKVIICQYLGKMIYSVRFSLPISVASMV